MKAKLLKRLRKEAKRKYVIKRKRDGYHVCVHIDSGLYVDPYFTAVSYKKIEAARNACNAVRREYILNQVRSRRNEYYEILDF